MELQIAVYAVRQLWQGIKESCFKQGLPGLSLCSVQDEEPPGQKGCPGAAQLSAALPTPDSVPFEPLLLHPALWDF